MAIGTTAAILGSAVIGAGASILGSKAQSKANSKAVAAQDHAAELQYDLGKQSIDLNRQIYNSNFGVLSPYASRGNVAGNALNALLGLGAAPVMSSPLAGTAPTTSGGTATAAAPTPLPRPVRPTFAELSGLPRDQRQDARADFRNDMQAYRASLPSRTGGGAAGAAGGANSAQQAFENFANSAGMQFQLKTAQDAINNGYAGAGSLQSGAAMKEISDRSQDIALNNYFLPYMGLLSGQQAVGAGAASSIAGVGTNFGNTVANINAGMGATAQNTANNLGNLYTAQGANRANMFANLGSSFGTALGGIAGGFGGGGGGLGPWSVMGGT